MFDHARLQERLKKWSSSLSNELCSPLMPPILLYQSIYALIHDLKSSIQISSDPQIQHLATSILNSDAVLRKLAHDDLEFNEADNQRLFELTRDLTDLEKLEGFLAQTVSEARSVVQGAVTVLSRDYPWDGLARARATSSARYGYQFLEHSTQVELHDLLAFGRTVHHELSGTQGIAITRHLEPLKPHHASPAGKNPAVMLLGVTQLVSAPPSGSAQLQQTKRWKLVH